MNTSLENAIASCLSRLGPMTDAEISETLTQLNVSGSSLKAVQKALKGNSTLFTCTESSWSYSPPVKKDSKDKKRPGPEETLPSANKKAKTSSSSVFQSQGSWGSTTSTSSSSTSATKGRKVEPKPSSSNSSMDTSDASSSEQSASKPVTPKLPFGFSFKPKEPSTVQPVTTTRKPSAASSSVETTPTPILSKPTIESTLPARFVAEGMSVDQALEKVVPKGSKTRAKKAETAQLIILDSANVSHQHGGGNFSTQGLPLAVDFYKSKGFRVMAFLPDHYITHHYPDPLQDWTGLEDLVKQKILIPTPAADYDDLYIVQFAKKNDGFIVSNDRYRDVPLNFTDPTERTQVAQWVKSHRIPFDFKGDTFVPSWTPNVTPS